MRVNVCAIIPARNEERCIENTLRQLNRSGVHHALIVCNGCSDRTVELVHQSKSKLNLSIETLTIPEPLGHDVPKAIGTIYVRQSTSSYSYFVYVDGDWLGSFGPMLESFIQNGIQSDQDITWVKSRLQQPPGRTETSRNQASFIDPWTDVRSRLPLSIRQASPSLMPLLVSSQTFLHLSPFWLHHPGKWFAYAAQMAEHTLRLGVDDAWDTRLIGHMAKNEAHIWKMHETLLGDAVEGGCVLCSKRPTRVWLGKPQIGYHHERRVDLLKSWMAQVHVLR